ncbi:MAG: c-type cytochrome domain-containing protein [Oligoflexales bacterium]
MQSAARFWLMVMGINFLIFGCSGSHLKKPPSASPPSVADLEERPDLPAIPKESPKEETEEEGEEVDTFSILQSQALAILDTNCSPCHNPVNAQGGFASVTNPDDMVLSTKYLVPGNPEESLVYQRMNQTSAGVMPPSKPLSPEAVQTIKDWIVEYKVKEQTRVNLDMDAVLTLIQNDLEKDDENVADTRYFSLHTFEASGASAAQLAALRQGFIKVINSVSVAVKTVKPVPIDPNQLIYKVHMRDIGMEEASFDALINQVYPYSTTSSDARFKDLQAKLGTNNFLLRADWFVATAMMSPVYNQLLNGGESISVIAQGMKLDLAANVTNLRVARSGFKKSGVSSQNRVIERQQSLDGRFFWQSYDFARTDATASIFANPFGPANLPVPLNPKAFAHDGGEMIFQLPNGFLGFYLSNNLGVRIDKGPLNIVKNTNGPANFLGAVVNGNSCLDCHRRGLLDKADDILDFVKNNNFSANEIELAEKLYPSREDFSELVTKDSVIYLKAMQSAGVGINAVEEPVKATTIEFYKDMGIAQVAAELGAEEDKVLKLLQSEPFVGIWGPLGTNSVITREEFNDLFGEAAVRVQRGITYIAPTRGDFLITPTCMVADPVKLDACFALR